MADDQALRQRIAHLPDPDLKRAAIAHQTRGVKADGVFAVGDRLGWRGEQWKFDRGTLEDRAERVRRQIARTGHEWQLGIDLADQPERRPALGAGAQNVERGIGVAAQAVARHAVDHALGHQLGDDVEPTREQI